MNPPNAQPQSQGEKETNSKPGTIAQPDPSFAGFLAIYILTPVLAGLALQLAMTILSRVHPVIELAAHFSFHALWGALLILPCLALARLKWAFRSALVLVLSLALVTKPWQLLPSSNPPNPQYKTSVKVLSWNLLAINQSVAEIHRLIKTEDPDVLVLIELSPRMHESLAPQLNKIYPNSTARPGWHGGGIAVFSRKVSAELQINEFGYSQRPAVVARISSPESPEPMHFVGVHTFSPSPVSRTEHRDRQIDNIIQWANDIDTPVCLAGDLNTTPWTVSFRGLLQAGFRDSRQGTGNSASWPSKLGFLGIPIDHALTRGACQITDRNVLPSGPGSDHLPISFQLHF